LEFLLVTFLLIPLLEGFWLITKLDGEKRLSAKLPLPYIFKLPVKASVEEN
jgi:hypothetical protein